MPGASCAPRSHVPELRHDFRRYYHVGYDQVGDSEACDLIMLLPQGSAYLASLNPAWAWSEEDERSASVVDQLLRIEQLMATRSTEGAPRVMRPADRIAAAEARKRAHAARVRLETTKWRDVEIE